MSLQQMPVDRPRTVRVLIVEDEPMIALGIEDVLIDAGFEIAGVAGKLDKALALIECGACDAAIVDANLAGVSAGPVADALVTSSLPFIVTSGYAQEQMHSQFSGAPFLQKPCRPELLIQTLKALVQNRLDD